jgi:hypothetical protein
VVSPISHPATAGGMQGCKQHFWSKKYTKVVYLPPLYHPWYLPQICETLIVATRSHANIPHLTSLIQSSVQGYHLVMVHLPDFGWQLWNTGGKSYIYYPQWRCSNTCIEMYVCYIKLISDHPLIMVFTVTFLLLTCNFGWDLSVLI